jgi:hypothetical protein
MNNEPILQVNPDSRRIHGVEPSRACHTEDAMLRGAKLEEAGLVGIPLSELRIYQNHGYRMCDRCFPLSKTGVKPG